MKKIKINKDELGNLHQHYIGASQVPVLFDCGFLSRNELLLQKKENSSTEATLRMRIGSALEAFLFSEVKDILSDKFSNLEHNDYDFALIDDNLKLMAIPDFVNTDEAGNITLVGEIKTTTSKGVNDEAYQLQLQTQLLLSGASLGVIVVYNFSRGELDFEFFYADENKQEQIKTKVKEFWEDYKKDYLPEESTQTKEMQEVKEIAIANEEVLKYYRSYCNLSELINTLQQTLDNLKTLIAQATENADKLQDENGATIAQWVVRKTETLDKTALKKHLLNDYKKFVTTKETRYIKINIMKGDENEKANRRN